MPSWALAAWVLRRWTRRRLEKHLPRWPQSSRIMISQTKVILLTKNTAASPNWAPLGQAAGPLWASSRLWLPASWLMMRLVHLWILISTLMIMVWIIKTSQQAQWSLIKWLTIKILIRNQRARWPRRKLIKPNLQPLLKRRRNHQRVHLLQKRKPHLAAPFNL